MVVAVKRTDRRSVNMRISNRVQICQVAVLSLANSSSERWGIVDEPLAGPWMPNYWRKEVWWR